MTKQHHLYHQLGFNANWNLDAMYDDGAGDRCILAPRFMEKEKIEKFGKPFRSHAVFDPQFFKPETAKQKLQSYDFFPEVRADGFDTRDYLDKWATKVAEECVAWQIAQAFEYITIPCRYLDGGGRGFLNKQEGLFVHPFIHEIRQQRGQQPVLLQVVLTSHMLLDDEFRRDLINWVTGKPEIQGVYLILEVEKRAKQLRDIKLLTCLMQLIDSFRANEMAVICGYNNTEALLLTLADPTGVTLGSYENTRIFNIRSFEEDEGKKSSPNARIYCSRILNWLNSDYVDAIKLEHPAGASFFDQTRYQAEMFVPSYQWHFNKSELYKHYFTVFGGQLRTSFELEPRARWEFVVKLLRGAMNEHQIMEEAGIFLDSDSAPSFLGQWLTAATQFGKNKGWA